MRGQNKKMRKWRKNGQNLMAEGMVMEEND